MAALIVYILLGIVFRLLCGYKGLVETVFWPLGVAATAVMKIREGEDDGESNDSH